SRQVRQIVDHAGLPYVQMVASGGLDEYEIDNLVQSGAPIDIFGVGTRVGTSADAPYTDMSYKLSCYDGRPVMKLSTDKISPPGVKQVYRLRDGNGCFERDVVSLQDEQLPAGERLLETVMEAGKKTRPEPALSEMRDRFTADFARLEDHFKQIVSPPRYPVTLSPALQRLTSQVQGSLMEQQGVAEN
ncbi:MAG: nicotinate phosphoribosyltransferase, partial [Chloroflexota bacterium]|nr:nicotinate phosphoribosyltransferase [Chloroflexota bacterium]